MAILEMTAFVNRLIFFLIIKVKNYHNIKNYENDFLAHEPSGL